MRTYDDAFSGQKIYPGKVRSNHVVAPRNLCARNINLELRLQEHSTLTSRETRRSAFRRFPFRSIRRT